MGFHYIHCFNLAMLAKQAWRLLGNPNSLCAIILRAEYYPNGDLLNTKLKKASSFTWQSIMEGVNYVKHGYIWRVRNGHNINIWDDAWIPNCLNRRVIIPIGGKFYPWLKVHLDPKCILVLIGRSFSMFILVSFPFDKGKRDAASDL